MKLDFNQYAGSVLEKDFICIEKVKFLKKKKK